MSPTTAALLDAYVFAAPADRPAAFRAYLNSKNGPRS